MFAVLPQVLADVQLGGEPRRAHPDGLVLLAGAAGGGARPSAGGHGGAAGAAGPPRRQEALQGGPVVLHVRDPVPGLPAAPQPLRRERPVGRAAVVPAVHGGRGPRHRRADRAGAHQRQRLARSTAATTAAAPPIPPAVSAAAARARARAAARRVLPHPLSARHPADPAALRSDAAEQ